MADVFSYIPKTGAATPPSGITKDPSTGVNVSWTLDVIKNQSSGVLQYGFIERVNDTQGVWFDNIPIWSIFTEDTQVMGDNSTVNNAFVSEVGEVKWNASGSALDIINLEGDKLFTDFIGEAQQKWDRRFRPGQPPTTGGTNIVGPPFAVEALAVAWFLTRPPAVVKVVNGVVTRA